MFLYYVCNHYLQFNHLAHSTPWVSEKLWFVTHHRLLPVIAIGLAARYNMTFGVLFFAQEHMLRCVLRDSKLHVFSCFWQSIFLAYLTTLEVHPFFTLMMFVEGPITFAVWVLFTCLWAAGVFLDVFLAAGGVYLCLVLLSGLAAPRNFSCFLVLLARAPLYAYLAISRDRYDPLYQVLADSRLLDAIRSAIVVFFEQQQQ